MRKANEYGITPGPWELTSDNATLPGYLLRSDAKPGYIAEVRAFTAQSEVDANARAIAEVPNMIEALEKAAVALENARYSEQPVAQELRELLARIKT